MTLNEARARIVAADKLVRSVSVQAACWDIGHYNPRRPTTTFTASIHDDGTEKTGFGIQQFSDTTLGGATDRLLAFMANPTAKRAESADEPAVVTEEGGDE